MTPQQDFDRIIALLEQNVSCNEFAAELLAICANGEISYHTFGGPSSGTTKNNLLGIYQIRWRMELDRPDDVFVVGYETLMPALKETQHPHICISAIDSIAGSYIVFSDFDKSDLIGILKSKRTLEEGREKIKKHKEIIGEPIENLDGNSLVFIKGKLQN